MTVQNWRAEATCRGTYGLMFDPEWEELARDLCSRCPVAAPCNDYAELSKPAEGLWAGVMAEDRARIRRGRSRRSQASMRG